VAGKVQALVPLPERDAHLRELAIPWSAAWVGIDAGVEPGQRVWSPDLPKAPVAIVPSRAFRGGKPALLVLRNERVVSVPVKVLGTFGTERTQVAGALRPGDVAVVASSAPLAEGMFVRFRGKGNAVETMPPEANAAAGVANIEGPGPAAGTAPSPETPARRVAPIGAPDSAAPKAATPAPAATKPAPKPGAVPF
jgi:hypothetical protein